MNAIIGELLTNLQSILGGKLVGLYLEGSLVLGDFDPRTSDIDLVAALAGDVDEGEYAALERMHAQIAAARPDWDDRIEVCYISTALLASVRSRTGWIVNISPGEPFHRVEAKREWLMNWYLTREQSRTLFGPSPKELIEPISKEEYIASVKDHARAWDRWVQDMKTRYAQSYAIFSLCRALYSVRNGEQASKKRAALWAKEQLPEWADVIQDAIAWKAAGKDDKPDEASFPRTQAFVRYVRGVIQDS